MKKYSNIEVTGSLNVLGSISATNIAATSSYATTASYALNGGGGGGASVTVANAVPTEDKISGSLWWNETDGNLYIQANAPSGSTYVPATSTVTMPTASYALTAVTSSYAETTPLPQFIYLGLPGDQTVNGGDAINFTDTIESNNLTQSGGYVTLTGGKVYELEATLRLNTSLDAIETAFRTSTGTQISKISAAFSTDYGNESKNPTVKTIYRPTVDTQVQAFAAGFGGSDALIVPNYCWMIIKEIR